MANCRTDENSAGPRASVRGRGCTVLVSNSGAWGSRPCGNKVKHDPDGHGNFTRCGTHSQAANDRRKAKSDARYKQESAVRQTEHDRRMARLNALVLAAELSGLLDEYWGSSWPGDSLAQFHGVRDRLHTALADTK